MHGKHGRRALSTEVYASKVPCSIRNPRVLQEISRRDNPRAQVEGQVGPVTVVGAVVVASGAVVPVPAAGGAACCAAGGGAWSPPASGRSGRRRSRYVPPADDGS